MYQTLTAKEGQWHPISDFEEKHAGKANIGNRVIELKYTGKRSGLWQLEVSGGQVRIYLNKAGAKQVGSDVTDDKQKIAADFAKWAVKAQDYEKDQSLSKYFQNMGVGSQSVSTLGGAVKRWTGSVNTNEAQNWRQVAMEFYGRNVSDEYTGAYKKVIGSPQSTQEVNKMRDAAMAMKAYASEYAKANHVNVVYRNVDGDLAQEIVKALKAGKTQIQVAMNSLSSWSDKKTLGISSGVKLRMKIDPDNVWAIHEATPTWFSSHKNEREYVIGAKSPKETFSIGDIAVEDSFMLYGMPEDKKAQLTKFAAAAEKQQDDVYVCVNHFDDDWLHKEESKENEE